MRTLTETGSTPGSTRQKLVKHGWLSIMLKALRWVYSDFPKSWPYKPVHVETRERLQVTTNASLTAQFHSSGMSTDCKLSERTPFLWN